MFKRIISHLFPHKKKHVFSSNPFDDVICSRIIQYLNQDDRIRFAHVCLDWRRVAVHSAAESIFNVFDWPPSLVLPLCLFSKYNFNSTDATKQMYSILFDLPNIVAVNITYLCVEKVFPELPIQPLCSNTLRELILDHVFLEKSDVKRICNPTFSTNLNYHSKYAPLLHH